MFLFANSSMPFGGKFLQQVLDKGPVVIILVIVIVVGYRRYTKVVDGFAEDIRKFMNGLDTKLTNLDIKLTKIINKLDLD